MCEVRETVNNDAGPEAHLQYAIVCRDLRESITQAPNSAFIRAMMRPPNMPKPPCRRPNMRVRIVLAMFIGTLRSNCRAEQPR